MSSEQTVLTDAEKVLGDIAARAGKTFVQAGSGAVAALWAGSGVNVLHLTQIPTDGKLIASACAAFVAAGASAVWNSGLAYVKAHRANLVSDAERLVADAATGPGANDTSAVRNAAPEAAEAPEATPDVNAANVAKA